MNIIKKGSAIIPIFINKKTGNPLSNVYVYAYRHSDKNEKIITIIETDDNGKGKKRLYVNGDKFDYYFFVSAFILGEASQDNDLITRDKIIVTSEKAITPINSKLLWISNKSEQKIELEFGSDIHEKFNEFKISTKDGKWTELKKDNLLEEIQERIKDPYKIDQDNVSLCGACAIIFILVFKNPAEYVTICKELYETGCFSRGGTKYKPIYGLNKSSPKSKKENSIKDSDWMLASTLTETENVILSASTDAGGITLPKTESKWCKDLLSSTGIIQNKSKLTPSIIETATNAGSFVIALIDSSILENKKSIIIFPDHWITIVKFSVSGKKIEWAYQTWGERYPRASNDTIEFDITLIDHICNFIIIA